MCFGGGQPEPPVNKPTYKASKASNFFDITMKDERHPGVKWNFSKHKPGYNKRATKGEQ